MIISVYVVIHQGDGASFIDAIYDNKEQAQAHVLDECTSSNHCWYETHRVYSETYTRGLGYSWEHDKVKELM